MRIENLHELVELQELYLAENKIARVEGLSALKKLRVLDLSFNEIERLENLEGNPALEELWLTHNRFANFADFEHIKLLASLQTVYFELCPVAKNPGYRQQVIDWAPQIRQVDHFRRDYNVQFKGAGVRRI